MNSLTDLREVVDVVIGVDTHVHTHSAAVIDAAAGGVLDEVTVEATAEGYAELVEFANNHAMLRAWAIEGTGGHGAGLSRHLMELSEIVIVDRPKRSARATARSPTRSTRSALPVKRWRGHDWALPEPAANASAVGLLAARRSAINASTEAQQQVFSLVIAAPETIRVRFRGQKLAAMLNTAASMRLRSSWDVETTSTVMALRTLARRAHAMLKEARELQKAIVAIIRSGALTCSRSSASDRSWRQQCCAPGPTPAASTPKQRSRCSPAWHRSRRTVAKSPPVTGSTATATASSTTHCTPWSKAGSSTRSHPRLRRPPHR